MNRKKIRFPYWGRSARTGVYTGRDIGKKSICAKRQIRDRQSLLDLVRRPIFFSVGFRFSIFAFRFCSFFFLLLLFPLAPPFLCSSKSPGRVDVRSVAVGLRKKREKRFLGQIQEFPSPRPHERSEFSLLADTRSQRCLRRLISPLLFRRLGILF